MRGYFHTLAKLSTFTIEILNYEATKLADLSHGGGIYRRRSFHKKWGKELIPLRGCTKGGTCRNFE